jgi:hypothetical protein
MVRLLMPTAILIVNYRAFGDLTRCLASLVRTSETTMKW